MRATRLVVLFVVFVVMVLFSLSGFVGWRRRHTVAGRLKVKESWFSVFENNPTLATIKPCANDGAPGVLFCVGCARDGAGHGFDAVGALEGKHPAGVFGREGADFVELLEFVCGEFEVDGGDVVVRAGRGVWLR